MSKSPSPARCHGISKNSRFEQFGPQSPAKQHSRAKLRSREIWPTPRRAGIRTSSCCFRTPHALISPISPSPRILPTAVLEIRSSIQNPPESSKPNLPRDYRFCIVWAPSVTFRNRPYLGRINSFLPKTHFSPQIPRKLSENAIPSLHRPRQCPHSRNVAFLHFRPRELD
jgi:hypothetical protein